MCYMALIPAAIAVGSAVIGYNQQKKQAKREQAAAEEDSANRQAALVTQSAQVSETYQDQIGARAREAMIERGRLAAIGASSGVAGNSRERLLNQSRFTEGADIITLDKNRRNALQQLQDEAKGVSSSTASRIAAIDQPNLLGTGLQIAGAAYGAYDKINTRQKKAA